MSEKKRIIEALKQKMKTQGVTYSQMAEHIGVSEATMKRYLSQGRFTLDTLDTMCEALNASLEELFEDFGARNEAGKAYFSLEQEKALAGNDLLFAVYYLAGGGWEFSSIMEHFDIQETVLIKLLVQLDRQGFIDYRSNDNLRVTQPIDTQWNPLGPLWMKYKRQAVTEFFNSDFGAENEHLNVAVGPVSHETAIVIRRRLVRAQKDIQNLLSLEDVPSKNIPTLDRYWFITAMRPMSLSALSKTAVDAAMKNLFGTNRK